MFEYKELGNKKPVWCTQTGLDYCELHAYH